jgi:hypothetical protein
MNFQKLPIELRLIIWKLSITGRIVQMYHCRQRIKSTCPTPALFRVNKESREVALKEYNKPGSETAFGEVIFSYDLDTLYLSNRSYAFHNSIFLLREMQDRWPEILAGLKFLAVRMNSIPNKDVNRFIKRISRFTALEEVTVVVHDNVIGFGQHETKLLGYEDGEEEFLKKLKKRAGLLRLMFDNVRPCVARNPDYLANSGVSVCCCLTASSPSTMPFLFPLFDFTAQI